MPDALDIGARPAAAPHQHRRTRCRSTTSTPRSARPTAAGSSRSTRDRSEADRRHAQRHPLRLVRQPPLLPHRCARRRPASPPPPKTWQELSEQAAAGQQAAASTAWASPSPTSATATCRCRSSSPTAAASPTTPARPCTIKSEETRAYLEWVTDALAAGALPARRDHLGRRRRQHRLPVRPGGLHRQHRQRRPSRRKDDDPELVDGTAFSPLPAGPKGRSRRSARTSAPSRRRRPEHRRAPRRCSSTWPTRSSWRRTTTSPSTARSCRTRAASTIFDRPGPRRPARSRRERHGPGLPGRLQHRLRRLLDQLPRPEDGPARRDRRLRPRRGDGRSPDQAPGDLRQVQVASRATSRQSSSDRVAGPGSPASAAAPSVLGGLQ